MRTERDKDPEGEEMTETRSTGREIQTEVLGVVRKSEEMLVNALRVWAEAVQ